MRSFCRTWACICTSILTWKVWNKGWGSIYGLKKYHVWLQFDHDDMIEWDHISDCIAHLCIKLCAQTTVLAMQPWTLHKIVTRSGSLVYTVSKTWLGSIQICYLIQVWSDVTQAASVGLGNSISLHTTWNVCCRFPVVTVRLYCNECFCIKCSALFGTCFTPSLPIFMNVRLSLTNRSFVCDSPLRRQRSTRCIWMREVLIPVFTL